MSPLRIGMVSLGCAKNLVDSEAMLSMFPKDRFEFTKDPASADLIIVNTCGFIESAKKESIETLLRMASYRKAKLVAVGCFVSRNLEELKASLPEIDLWVPLEEYSSLHLKIAELLGEKEPLLPFDQSRRILSGASWSAYLKISEGCDNMCSFCAIPLIKGRLHSRPMEELLKEARSLLEKGVKELTLISQDPMHYGDDFPNKRPNMLDLLKALDPMGFHSIRLLYLYPEEITDETLLFIKNSKSILPYFDIPIQSASPSVLKRMNRHGSLEEMKELFQKIDRLFPIKALRTTLIAGFPGETKANHLETLSFLEEFPFDHLGVFTYSKEEGTMAYRLKGQVPSKEKERRKAEIMDLARKESYRLNKARIGERMRGYVIGKGEKEGTYLLRSYWNAPDDIDGTITFEAKVPHESGEIVEVEITNAFVHDLYGVER